MGMSRHLLSDVLWSEPCVCSSSVTARCTCEDKDRLLLWRRLAYWQQSLRSSCFSSVTSNTKTAGCDILQLCFKTHGRACCGYSALWPAVSFHATISGPIQLFDISLVSFCAGKYFFFKTEMYQKKPAGTKKYYSLWAHICPHYKNRFTLQRYADTSLFQQWEALPCPNLSDL